MKPNKTTIRAYETDASQIKGKAADVLLPSTIAEVRNAVRVSSRITIRGGGTGLVGGAVPQNAQDVVLDLSKLNHIIKLDRQRRTIEVEAGVILDELNFYLKPHGLEFPVQPSSHAVCTIGGMIATNAVGSRATKYGKTSKWVNWVEVIDSQGNLNKKTTTELSDYAGMEGITGVIVKACLKLETIKSRTMTFIQKQNLEEVIELTRQLKRNPNVSAIELLGKKVSSFLGLNKEYHLLVEFESEQGELNEEESKKAMKIRDSVYPILTEKKYLRIEDPHLLLDRMSKLIFWLEARDIPFFGHIGAGIIHPCFKKHQEKLIPEMIKFVRRIGGQISGEHGIGLLKKEFVDPNDKRILVNIKKRTDTQNKFNIGKVI